MKNGRENKCSSFSGNDLYEEFARGRGMGKQRSVRPSNPVHFNDDPFFGDYFGPSLGRPNQHAFTAPPCVSETTWVRYDPHFQSENLTLARKDMIPQQKENTKQYETNFDQMPGHQTPSKVELGEIITPDTKELLTSPDCHYYAGLKSDCDLIVVCDEGPDKEDTIIWSSDTFLPP
eukprot:15364337-Ditylum_brightwellii.AAC.1